MDASRAGRTLRTAANLLAVNAAAAVVVNLLFGPAPWRTGVPLFVEGASITFLFSTCCSSLCVIALPRLVPLVRCRVRSPLDWAIIAVALIGFAAAGDLIAVSILTAIGYIRSVDRFLAFCVGSLKISIIVTLLFGIFGVVTEGLRHQLDAATLALRTKERDEAEARRLVAETQLASLESRVEPHFLFNTLNSIAELVRRNPAGAERMTEQLAALLRSSLDRDAPLVALDEELRLVRAYLDIERVRFGDRLRYDVQTGNGAGTACIPRLAVQTLVENSVKYAVSPRPSGAAIAVRAEASNGRLRVEVRDDGPGFDAASLPDGHGLALLRARLATLFGDRAALRIDSAPHGTRVTVELPSSG